MNHPLVRSGGLVLAFILGGFLPQLSCCAFLIRYLIVAMLFLVFLSLRSARGVFFRSHWRLAVANLLLGVVPWALFRVTGEPDLALAAFFTGIAPTAAAAATVMRFLGGRYRYVLGGFLATSGMFVFALPLLLGMILARPWGTVFWEVAGSLAFVIGVPCLGALLLRRTHPAAAEWPRRLGSVPFWLWVAAIVLISADASKFLRENSFVSGRVVWGIFFLSLVLCILNFGIGRVLGGKRLGRETSQALGQKNTALCIYLALAYASPLVALGPTFYVLWHNLWNAWQLARHGRSR